MSYYRSTNLFVQTDVSTAITTTMVLYVVYYNNLPLTLLNGEGKFTLEQAMMTYTDSGEMSLLFLTSRLNEAEYPMTHNGQATKFSQFSPIKLTVRTLVLAENFSDRQTKCLTHNSESNVCYTSIYRSQPTSRS